MSIGDEYDKKKKKTQKEDKIKEIENITSCFHF